MNSAAEEIASMKLYLETPVEGMAALDVERRAAEMDCCDDASVWFDLACRYEAQGRPAQAASCRRRGEHYAPTAFIGVDWAQGPDQTVYWSPVSTETAGMSG